MRHGIVGGSASGIYLALLLRENHPDDQIVIFDHCDKLGKKIYATGNGRCNVLHEEPKPEDYNNPEFLADCFAMHPYGELKAKLESWGIALSKIGDLVYPSTFSAPAFVHYLEMLLKEAHIEIRLETNVLDYKLTPLPVLCTNKGEFSFDRVYFCTGGSSGINLGSDGSLFPVFKRHGYDIVPLVPGLAPIKVTEKVKPLANLRHKALVALMKDGQPKWQEEGEVLFKNDGLSGIVIFNASSLLPNLGKGTKIHLDLFPEFSLSELEGMLEASSKRSFYLDAYLQKPFIDYLKSLGAISPKDFARLMKNLSFTYESNYGFKDSQVTLGGVSLKNLMHGSLESKLEPHIYFLGECLDIAGKCGGYNLSWCLLSAFIAAEKAAE